MAENEKAPEMDPDLQASLAAEQADLESYLEPEEPYESETARYIRVRAAAKEEAAVTMAAEAKAAQKAKAKRLGKAPVVEGQAEFLKAAAEVEKSINAKPTEKKES